MESTAAESYIFMTHASAELALLSAWISDLQSQMIIAEAHDEMGDGHWMDFLRAALSDWKELPYVPVGACHTWTRSSRLSTTKPAPPSSNPSRAEPSVKIWKSAGGMEARV